MGNHSQKQDIFIKFCRKPKRLWIGIYFTAFDQFKSRLFEHGNDRGLFQVTMTAGRLFVRGGAWRELLYHAQQPVTVEQAANSR